MLHPHRHVLVLGEDRVLWAPDLDGLSLARSPRLAAVLRILLPRLAAGGGPEGPAEEAVAAHLRERGLLVEGSPGAPCPEEPAPPGPDVITDGPVGEGAARGLREVPPGAAILLADTFDPAAWRGWWEDHHDASVRVLALAGDGRRGFAYADRPGRDACPECLLRRWLSARGDDPALRLVVEAGMAFRWAPATSAEGLGEAVRRALARPGRAVLIEPGGRREARFLPVPACSRCRPPRRVPRRAWSGHDLGLVKDLAARRGLGGLVLLTARLGSPRWATGGAGFDSGTGCARSIPRARRAALGEALERYAAAVVPGDLSWGETCPGEPFPEPLFTAGQLREPGFPYRSPEPGERIPWLPVRRLGEPGEAARAPAEQVLLLREGFTAGPDVLPVLSHGLACGSTLRRAAAAALLERLERDATARFWASLTAGRPLGALLERARGRLLVEVPCPGGVRAVAAFLRDGQGRVAAGAACRPDRRAAARKALLEARHNRALLLRCPGEDPGPGPEGFEAHGRYYWHRPGDFPWEAIGALPPAGAAPAPPGPLLATLREEGLPVYLRDLTPPDVRAAGFRVARVLVPGLLHLPSHHRAWPMGQARWGGLPAPRLPHPFA